MPCAHRKVDVSQHRTTPRPGTEIRVVEEEAALPTFWGWLPARKKRPKKYQQVAELRRLLSHQKHVPNNWLRLQQTTAAATGLSPLVAAAACCCIAVTRASPNKRGTVYAHMVLYPPSSSAAWNTLVTMSHST